MTVENFMTLINQSYIYIATCVEQMSSAFLPLLHSVILSLLSSLRQNFITEEGAYRMAEMLETNTSLQTLE